MGVECEVGSTELRVSQRWQYLYSMKMRLPGTLGRRRVGARMRAACEIQPDRSRDTAAHGLGSRSTSEPGGHSTMSLLSPGGVAFVARSRLPLGEPSSTLPRNSMVAPVCGRPGDAMPLADHYRRQMLELHCFSQVGGSLKPSERAHAVAPHVDSPLTRPSRCSHLDGRRWSPTEGRRP